VIKTASISDLVFQFDTRFPKETDERFEGYIAEGRTPELTIDPEPWLPRIVEATDQDPSGVEFYAVSVALGDTLPFYNRLQTHGVALEYEGRAYIFSAPSGTGKSTRAFIWQEHIGGNIINGDKPILHFLPDHSVLACGSPWSGKEGLQQPRCVPLGGLCLLERSEENTIRRASAQEYFDFFLKQVQVPQSPEGIRKALELIEALYADVPVWLLRNDNTTAGLKVCFEALTGKKYREVAK